MTKLIRKDLARIKTQQPLCYKESNVIYEVIQMLETIKDYKYIDSDDRHELSKFEEPIEQIET